MTNLCTKVTVRQRKLARVRSHSTLTITLPSAIPGRDG